MVYKHPTNETIREVLERSQVIAVVGLSNKSERISYQVSDYMKNQGYENIPVNPNIEASLGEKAYASLIELPNTKQIDIVNVFRRSEETVEIAKQAVQIGAKALWLQLGVYNEEAFQIAQEGGLIVIMDRCIKVDHAMYA